MNKELQDKRYSNRTGHKTCRGRGRLTYKDNHTNELYYSIGGGLNIALYYGIELNLRVGFKRKK